MQSKPDRNSALADRIVEVIGDHKGEETLVLDLEGASLGIDRFIITAADNRRHLHAIVRSLKEDLEVKPYRIEGLNSAVWAVLDFGSIVVHVLDREARRFYDLEGLWKPLTRLDASDRSEGP